MGISAAVKKEKTIGRVVQISASAIRRNPAQPRENFGREQLEILAESIRANGLLQPLTVRRISAGSYELISGERRLRACMLLGMTEVPCMILEKTDREAAVLALIENIHREDLNLFEQAKALKSLITEWGVTQEEAAAKLGMAQSTVANKLRLLKFSPEEEQIILAGNLTERHARAALRLEAGDVRKKVLTLAVQQGWNVSKTEAYIESLSRERKRRKGIPVIRDVRLFLNTINKAIRVMKEAGVPAVSEQKEAEEYIEYIVRIPKQPGLKRE